MKITIESTQDITLLDDVQCRVWQGVTEKGTPCLVFTYRIATHPDVNADEFAAEMKEGLPPARLIDLLAVLFSDDPKRSEGN